MRKSDDNASSSCNSYQSSKFEDNKAASYRNSNIVNLKNVKTYIVNDNVDKTFNNKISRPMDIDNFEIEKNLLCNKIIENDKLIGYEKYDNCKTVFTKNGVISKINENPENSLMHSRLFSSTISPNSSVEMFEYDKTKDFNLNRNADCPNFLPNIVKELKCFQSSNIDNENATP